MKTPLYIVDSFTSTRFCGNPAAVCPLEQWLDDQTMQKIAAENNLSETAFFVPRGDGEFNLRWFTPTAEVDLCGHATLAAAYVIFNFLYRSRTTVTFHSLSGPLTVERGTEGLMVMDFPATPGEIVACPPLLSEGLGTMPIEVRRSRDYMAVLESQREVELIRPRLDMLAQLDCLGIIVTAPGSGVDFVSRAFFPRVGIPEDPVTGSAHCTLTPYWGDRLEKHQLSARQISARGGELQCTLFGNRVRLAGRAVLYLEGAIHLDAPRA